MLSTNQISWETIERAKRFMLEVIGEPKEFEQDWWCERLGLVGLVIDWVENGEGKGAE